MAPLFRLRHQFGIEAVADLGQVETPDEFRREPGFGQGLLAARGQVQEGRALKRRRVQGRAGHGGQDLGYIQVRRHHGQGRLFIAREIKGRGLERRALDHDLTADQPGADGGLGQRHIRQARHVQAHDIGQGQALAVEGERQIRLASPGRGQRSGKGQLPRHVVEPPDAVDRRRQIAAAVHGDPDFVVQAARRGRARQDEIEGAGDRRGKGRAVRALAARQLDLGRP